MLYAIICYNDEKLVSNWSKDEDDAVMARLGAILAKEFIQMRRDRLTFAMLVGIPLMQLMLFGFAINADPKALPTAVRIADHSPFSRSLLAELENSDYFRIVTRTRSEAEASRLLETGAVQFVVNVPAGFGRATSFTHG